MQARAVGQGFAWLVHQAGLRIWACSILPEHTHVVVARHRWRAEVVASRLKAESTRRLNQQGIHPLRAFATRLGRTPKAWARGQWKVYLDSESDLRRAMRYVEDNPAKEGLPPQRWSFVTKLDG